MERIYFVLMMTVVARRINGAGPTTDGNIFKALPVAALYKKGANLTITCSGSHTILVEEHFAESMKIEIKKIGDNIAGPIPAELDDSNPNPTYWTYELRYKKENINLTDNGVYTCIMTDGEKEKYISNTTVYMADSKPEIIAPSPSNNEVSLHCDINVEPKTNLLCQWFVDRNPVKDTDEQYSTKGCSMKISKFNAQDAGKSYSCRVGTEEAIKHYGSLTEATTAVFQLQTYFVMTTKLDAKQCVAVYEPKDGSKHKSIQIDWGGVDGNVTDTVNGRVVFSCKPENADVSNGSISVTVGEYKKKIEAQELFTESPPETSSAGEGLSDEAIAGIVVGVCILIWVILNVIFSCCCDMWKDSDNSCTMLNVCICLQLLFGAVIIRCCKKKESEATPVAKYGSANTEEPHDDSVTGSAFETPSKQPLVKNGAS